MLINDTLSIHEGSGPGIWSKVLRGVLASAMMMLFWISTQYFSSFKQTRLHDKQYFNCKIRCFVYLLLCGTASNNSKSKRKNTKPPLMEVLQRRIVVLFGTDRFPINGANCVSSSVKGRNSVSIWYWLVYFCAFSRKIWCSRLFPRAIFWWSWSFSLQNRLFIIIAAILRVHTCLLMKLTWFNWFFSTLWQFLKWSGPDLGKALLIRGIFVGHYSFFSPTQHHSLQSWSGCYLLLWCASLHLPWPLQYAHHHITTFF